MSPRKKSRAVAVEEADEAPDFDIPPSAEEMEDAERLADFQAKFGGKDYKVRVDKWNREDSEWEYVCLSKLDGFDPFLSLQKSHGGGKYRLTLLDDGGRYVKGGRQEIRIAEVAKAEAEPVKTSALQDPAVVVVMQMLQAQAAQATEMVKAMISAQASRPAEQPITELVGALSKLQSMVPRDGDNMKGVKDALEILTAAKSLLPEKEAAEGGGVLSEVLEAVKAGKELGFFDRHRPVTPSAPRPSLAAPGAVVPVVHPVMQESPMPDPIAEAVRAYIPLIVSRAKRNEPPADAADFIVTEMVNEVVPVVVENYRPGGMRLNADFVLTSLLDKAKDPAEVERIFTFAPVLAMYRDWVLAVVAEAVRIMETPEAEAASDSEPPT